MKIGLKWANVIGLMEKAGYYKISADIRYKEFTKRIEKMFQKEFNVETIKIEWLD